MERPYYEAYDDRYRVAHENGVRWFDGDPTPLVGKVIQKYGITKETPILEVGCGEGRDALPLLSAGYRVTATDLSEEAINYCRTLCPEHADAFFTLDCVRGTPPGRFGFVYAVAVLHMLTDECDRAAFYSFIASALAPDGIALVCSMGDGKAEYSTDPALAFTEQPRRVRGITLNVAATTCRIVSMTTFEAELSRTPLSVLKTGFTEIPGNFDRMLYAVVGSGPRGRARNADGDAAARPNGKT